MASFKNCFSSSSMAIIFLAISSFNLNGCYVSANLDLIDSVCKQSQDFEFCSDILGSDARARHTSDLHDLALISISLTIIQIHETLGHIPGIIRKSSDPVAKQRLEVCETGYNDALGNFQGAFNVTSHNAYFDTINFVRDGTNQVIDCHNIFRRSDPIATSPIAGDDIKVFKLSEIILLFIDGLIPKR